MLPAIIVIALTISPAHSPSVVADSDSCCFTNPQFTGVCTVVPDEERTCADILAYLNNPNSVGRNYCKNTKIRGGWKQVTCEEESSTCQEANRASREGPLPVPPETAH